MTINGVWSIYLKRGGRVYALRVLFFEWCLQPSESERLLDYEYMFAQAIVGKRRLNDLWNSLGERIKARVITGNKEFKEFFNGFTAESKFGQGMMGPKAFHRECLHSSLNSITPRLAFVSNICES